MRKMAGLWGMRMRTSLDKKMKGTICHTPHNVNFRNTMVKNLYDLYDIHCKKEDLAIMSFLADNCKLLNVKTST